MILDWCGGAMTTTPVHHHHWRSTQSASLLTSSADMVAACNVCTRVWNATTWEQIFRLVSAQQLRA